MVTPGVVLATLGHTCGREGCVSLTLCMRVRRRWGITGAVVCLEVRTTGLKKQQCKQQTQHTQKIRECSCKGSKKVVSIYSMYIHTHSRGYVRTYIRMYTLHNDGLRYVRNLPFCSKRGWISPAFVLFRGMEYSKVSTT